MGKSVISEIGDIRVGPCTRVVVSSVVSESGYRIDIRVFEDGDRGRHWRSRATKTGFRLTTAQTKRLLEILANLDRSFALSHSNQ